MSTQTGRVPVERASWSSDDPKRSGNWLHRFDGPTVSRTGTPDRQVTPAVWWLVDPDGPDCVDLLFDDPVELDPAQWLDLSASAAIACHRAGVLGEPLHALNADGPAGSSDGLQVDVGDITVDKEGRELWVTAAVDRFYPVPGEDGVLDEYSIDVTLTDDGGVTVAMLTEAAARELAANLLAAVATCTVHADHN